MKWVITNYEQPIFRMHRTFKYVLMYLLRPMLQHRLFEHWYTYQNNLKIIKFLLYFFLWKGCLLMVMYLFPSVRNICQYQQYNIVYLPMFRASLVPALPLKSNNNSGRNISFDAEFPPRCSFKVSGVATQRMKIPYP